MLRGQNQGKARLKVAPALLRRSSTLVARTHVTAPAWLLARTAIV
jgi:hypothetical protein